MESIIVEHPLLYCYNIQIIKKNESFMHVVILVKAPVNFVSNNLDLDNLEIFKFNNCKNLKQKVLVKLSVVRQFSNYYLQEKLITNHLTCLLMTFRTFLFCVLFIDNLIFC